MRELQLPCCWPAGSPLGDALKALPQLEALKLVHAKPGSAYNTHGCWPFNGITACTRLRSLIVDDTVRSLGLTRVPATLRSLAKCVCGELQAM